MRNFGATIVLGAALLVGGAATASAADLYGGSIKDGYMPAPMASTASWYVRLDGGYGWHDDPSMIEDARWDLGGAAIDDTWTLGGGIGRYFTRNVRADITWDHRFEADASGMAGGGAPFANGVRRFGLTSDVVLANVYYDFDRNGRINPYIGMGLGFTYNRTSNGTVTDPCGCTGVIEGAEQWSVAGALMTGLSLKIRDRMHVDAGYRFLYLGEAHTGVITGTAGGNPAVSGDPVVSDIYAHEFRVGLRYDIR